MRSRILGVVALWLSLRARAHVLDGDERGASLVEYALLLALIAVVCVGAISLVGGATSSSLSRTASGFTP